MVVNNQIGFTTTPSEARSSPHPTDFAKCIGAPILHVNADDPEAVVRACVIAADWRALFRRDVVVDLVGYRRRGHNELDGPRTTLPWTYELIERHPSCLELYTGRLAEQGVVSARKVKDMRVHASCLQTFLQSIHCTFLSKLCVQDNDNQHILVRRVGGSLYALH